MYLGWIIWCRLKWDYLDIIMEQNMKCNVEECGNAPKYHHTYFKINICEDHCQPQHKQHCIKLGNIDEITQTLEVVRLCIKSLTISMELSNNSTLEPLISLLTSKAAKISSKIPFIPQNPSLILPLSISAKSLLTRLKSTPEFQSFCTETHISLLQSYLANTSSPPTEAQLPQLGQLRDVQQHLSEMKQRVISTVGIATMASFRKTYWCLTNKQASKNNEVLVNCECEEDVEFMRCIGENVLPRCSILSIDKIKNQTQFVRDWLAKSTPTRLTLLELNLSGPMIQAEEICEAIMHASPFITNGLCLYEMKIDKDQLENILKVTCKNQKSLSFKYCKIEVDQPLNLEDCMDSSRLEELDLGYCGLPEYCDWQNYPKRFSHLIQGLSQLMHFRHPFKKIYLERCGISLYEVREILYQHGFINVEIHNHSV
ncbi:unnamed protein product [Moneuplotes crassus]|uniref:Uncharacterized protein n=1 Tax=Euplotes crassus TaxID=5936 RepID=A0AAD1XFT3_EUPCR|nr:unnamed protein product [Moneuplotes crassus]